MDNLTERKEWIKKDRARNKARRLLIYMCTVSAAISVLIVAKLISQ